jgi:putative MATE family efflux protein
LKNQKYVKEFTKYTSSNIIAMLFVSSYILADTFFISWAMGAYGLAALNFGVPAFGFVQGSGFMLGIGGATLYNIKKNQGDDKGANQVFTNTILLMLGFILFFVVAGQFFSPNITRLLGTDEAIFEMTRIYVQVILLFAPVMMTNMVLGCFMRNDGAPRLAMFAMAGNNMANILLDYVFLIRMELGMLGGALASGLATFVSLFMFLIYFLMKKNGFHLIRCKPTIKSTKGIFAVGFPAFITEASVSVVMITFNIIILSISGNVGVAAFGVIANIFIVVIAIYNGLAGGVQPLISKYHGRNESKYVHLMLRYALLLVVSISATVYLGLFFGANPIVGIFNSEQNPYFQQLAVSGLRIYFAGIVFVGFNIVLTTYFASIENVRPAHGISLLRGFIVILPMVFLLSQLGGITGVWLSFPLAELVVSGIGCVMFAYYRKRYKGAGMAKP